MGTQSISSRVLMSQVETKCRILIKTERWEAPTAMEEILLAMQARLTSLQQKLDAKKGASNKRKEEEGEEGEGKGSRKKSRGKDKKEKPEWFKKPPAPRKMHETKNWNNIDWHYCCNGTCGHCGDVWCNHRLKKCQSNTNKKYKKNQEKLTTANKKKTMRKQ